MGGIVDKPLKTIQRDDTPITTKIGITDLEYVASYNWVEAEEPTILVPGERHRPSIADGRSEADN